MSLKLQINKNNKTFSQHVYTLFNKNIKFIISFLSGIIIGGAFLMFCHTNLLHNQNFIENFLIPFCDMRANYATVLNNSRNRIIWTDPIIGLGMIIVTILNLFISTKLLFDKPITDVHMCILWAVLGWELVSCGYCFGYLTDNYWIIFSICPDIRYPRLGLIGLIFMNLGTISIQHHIKKKWATLLVVFLAAAILMLILSVLVIMTGSLSHH